MRSLCVTLFAATLTCVAATLSEESIALEEQEDVQVVGECDESLSGCTGIPEMRIETDVGGAQSDNPTYAKVNWNGGYYDATIRRRGSGRRSEDNMFAIGSSKDWPKKKFKLDFDGASFPAPWGMVEEVNLHSAYEEPGEESYIREALALRFFSEVGVAAPSSEFVLLYLNDEFWGLYTMVEEVDKQFLERTGLGGDSQAFKAVHWKYSNLRPVDRSDACPFTAPDYDYWDGCPEIWRSVNGDEDTNSLMDLSDQIANGDLSGVNVGAAIREAAAQTVMLHQDRCTKNYFMVNNAGTWTRVPWDLDQAFATDYTDGTDSCGGCGSIDSTYCRLTCDSWNSPLFCDADHPQDVFTDGDGRSTYNHLIDAILKNPSMRQEYLGLVNEFANTYGGRDGWLGQEAKKMRDQLKPAADEDNEKWGSGDIDWGVNQLLDQLDTRKSQLV